MVTLTPHVTDTKKAPSPNREPFRAKHPHTRGATARPTTQRRARRKHRAQKRGQITEGKREEQ